MPNLPLHIDLHGSTVLIAGGGRVAGRKARALLDAGSTVKVVAPRISPEIETLAANGNIMLRIGHYEARDLDGAILVVAATDNAEANLQIADDAKQNKLLVVVTDAPELGNCIFPAVLRRGSLEISVSSGGSCPAFAAEVRDMIAGIIGDEYGAALEHLAAEREKLLTAGNSSTYNSTVMHKLVQRMMAKLSENNPDKHDTCVDEIISCRENADNNF